MTGCIDVVLGGAALRLDPRGAAVEPVGRTGFVADLHLGKTTLFRRRGLAVPEGDEAGDLARLEGVVAAHGLERLVILGDLVHAAGGLAPEVVGRFAGWRDAHPGVEVVLVRGNHDRGAGGLPPSWRLDPVEGPHAVGGIVCRHEPREPSGDAAAEPGPGPTPEAITLAGHLHPVVRLGGRGRGPGLRARCFWWRPPTLILPAFGTFTGGGRVSPSRGERVFAIPPMDPGDPDSEALAVVEVTGAPGVLR